MTDRDPDFDVPPNRPSQRQQLVNEHFGVARPGVVTPEDLNLAAGSVHTHPPRGTSRHTHQADWPAAHSVPPTVRKRTPGRPKGSKNKPKSDIKPAPKPRGRPLGALDKGPRKSYTWKSPNQNSRITHSPLATPTPQRARGRIATPLSPTMPYNNAAIAPPEEITGQCTLPRKLSRMEPTL